MQTESHQAFEIVLTTINARYIHSAFGLRYLQANLGELQDRCSIEEFTLESRVEDMAEQILSHRPKIIGIGIYIWNAVQSAQLIALLKTLSPETAIILGGPEVSYEQADQASVQMADYVISGWGEQSFAELAESLLAGDFPEQKLIAGAQANLNSIEAPYHLYTQDDIDNRVLYVEASRGCPFKCEFCLSALDKTAWPFDLDKFLDHMDELYQRGARHFKFVDRTFNLKIKNSLRILQFFLDRMDEQMFLHFEVIPDHLPDALKEKISQFPAESLQFEIGIQTFNQEVQSRISRRQDNEKARHNIAWIMNNTQAHVHTDLIFGLPGETTDSFADSFDQLYALRPHEIQVGILKRLKGSPIVRHTDKFQLAFNPNPPFSIVSSTTVDYLQVQQMNRFARYWDLIGNSGRFKNSLPVILCDQPFDNFSRLSAAIYQRTGQTHKISLLRLYDLVFDIAVKEFELPASAIQPSLQLDFEQSGLKSLPRFLRKQTTEPKAAELTSGARRNARQSRH